MSKSSNADQLPSTSKNIIMVVKTEKDKRMKKPKIIYSQGNPYLVNKSKEFGFIAVPLTPAKRRRSNPMKPKKWCRHIIWNKLFVFPGDGYWSFYAKKSSIDGISDLGWKFCPICGKRRPK